MKQIILREASLGYGKKVLLSNVNLLIDEGDICLIKGPNGSGKTTLALGLLGILKLASGFRYFSFVRPAYVPQASRFDLQYPITLEELVAMGLREYCTSHLFVRNSWRKRMSEKTQSALSRVGLSEKGRKLFHQVSGGEFQRALIARALISEPDVILLDEPFANIDKQGKQEIKELLLAESARLNCTLIIIDHHENVDFCTKCLAIENGTVKTNGVA
ncbi:MAG: ATP-binding cassette domain-containing protein [Spirochaetes bacterium]|nr:ATP-binding cassette domain-containing protein [Spirochaetota bacterium]